MALGATSQAALDVQWEHVYGVDGRTYNPSAMAGGPDRSLYIAGTSAAPGLGGKAPEFWLWKVDAVGKLEVETVIARAQGSERIVPSADHIRDLVADANGGAMIIEFKSGDPYFLRFDAGAQVRLMKRLEIPERRVITLFRLLAEEKGYLALGGADGRAFALRIGGDGSVTWSAPAAGVDLFVDGVLLPGGGFIALGYSAAQPGKFLLSYFGPDGSVQRVVPLSGRKASLASGPDGPMVVYDGAEGDEQDVRVAVVKNGALTGETKVPIAAQSFQPDFEIAPMTGSFLIGGPAQEGIVALEYSDRRVRSRLDLGESRQPYHWMLKRVLGDPAAALTVVYGGSKPLTTKVGIIRFKDN